MIPGQHLSSYTGTHEFLAPDDLYDSRWPFVDWERGGADLYQPIIDDTYYVWRIHVENHNKIILSRFDNPDIGPYTIRIVTGLITEVSFSFDQNTNYAVAYVANDVSYLWFYDSDLGSFRELELTGAITPRLTLDDKRYRQRVNSDIILFYLKNGHLYYRQQRDRFTIERDLLTTDAIGIARTGMATSGRVQIELVMPDQSTCVAIGELGTILNAFPNTLYESETITLGNCVPANSVASITVGEYRTKINAYGTWSDWKSQPSYVSGGYVIQARAVSFNSYSAVLEAIFNAYDFYDTFTISNMVNCGPEGNFLIFEALINKRLSTEYQSEIVTATVCILDDSIVSFTGVGEYRQNGGDWTTDDSTAQVGDTFQIRLISSANVGETYVGTLTVGDYSGDFSVTTRAVGCIDQYSRPVDIQADATWENATDYQRPNDTQADAEFLPLC